jgi:Holliday junction resolvase RusA-like endonuclease
MPGVFRLTVDGAVGAKGRPRTRVIYKNNRAVPVIYPDPDSLKTERAIKGLAWAAMARQRLQPFTGPIEITIEVFLKRPVSWPRKRCESAFGFFATGKPDVDNLQKLWFDAFNKVVWDDDSQISDVLFRRRFAPDGRAHVNITVRELVLPEYASGDLLTLADGA